ncbi:energy transducer TonB [Bdellovibrio bacteriovorus]|uniref:Energy transducer TonB n=1 Tax=Bdellovibrio bacteriovorus TaxID=959 RepID=A0A150WRQ0_BDEBC|nr:energy transducer TonB [Bdellovibrio bacteriovorus]KYG67056.1 energy transducer TonB [Bdellovibrio bacteriovorus]
MKKSPSFRMYMLLSLVAHAIVVASLLVAEKLTPSDQPKETVSINFLTPEDLQKMAQIEEAVKQRRERHTPNNQVVEQNEDTANNVAPEDSRFLSAKNQKVEKQTVAKNRGEFQNLKKPSAEKAGAKGDGRKKVAEVKEESKKMIEKDIFKGFDSTAALDNQKLAEEKVDKGLGEGQGSQNSGVGGETSQTNDYLKDVDQGLETLLNTREFKYYSYYNRIRKQLSQHWEGRVREKLTKLFKEGRAPAATNKDRVTKVLIVLNDAGTLVRVQVLSDSGVRDLDDAAIEAFRDAAPFPNPPKGIVETDGTVKIRWDFVLEV